MTTTVSRTYRWQNGLAMTFDQHGEQIPDLQGPATDELATAIRLRSTSATEWVGWGDDGPAVFPTDAVESTFYAEHGYLPEANMRRHG